MGGKGSGRHEKPLKEVIAEMTEEIVELKNEVRGRRDDYNALYKTVTRLESKVNYWLKKGGYK